MLNLPRRDLRAVRESWRRARLSFEELIAQAPDITLFELRDALADAEGIHQPVTDDPASEQGGRPNLA